MSMLRVNLRNDSDEKSIQVSQWTGKRASTQAGKQCSGRANGEDKPSFNRKSNLPTNQIHIRLTI